MNDPAGIIAPSMEAPESPAKAVAAAAKELEASVRDLPKGAWLVSGGTRFCTNSNDAPWSAIVVRGEDGRWTVTPRPAFLPWTRGRLAPVAELRAAQLAAQLAAPRPLTRAERHPFHAGDSPAEQLRAFAWRTAEGAAAMLLVLAAVTAMGLVILDGTARDLLGRAEVLTRLGVDPIPRAGELASGRFGGALLLAAPIAFFLGLVHASVHFVGARFLAVARFAPWASAFLALVTAGAVAPRAAWYWVPILGLLVPGAALLGSTLAWGRGRDVRREPDAPRRKAGPVAWAAGLVLLGAVALLVPLPRADRDRIESTALFRDRFLLTSRPGRAFADFYYRHTRWAVEALALPVQPSGPAGASGFERQQRTALVIGAVGGDEKGLKELDFAIERVPEGGDAEPLLAKRQHDLYVLASSVTAPLRRLRELGLLDRTLAIEGNSKRPDDVPKIALLSNEQAWRDRLVRLYEPGLLGSLLLELTGEGWVCLFYLGPVVLLVALLALASALVAPAWTTSARAGRIATAALCGLVLAAFAVHVAVSSGNAGRIREIRAERIDDVKTIEILKAGLADSDPDVRHEAVYRAYQCLGRSTFPRGALVPELLKAAEDPEVRIRLWAAPALGRSHDERGRAAIHRAMNDPEIFVRYRAAQALGHLDSPVGRAVVIRPTTTAALRKMIREGSWYEQTYALEAYRHLIPGTL